MKGNIFSFHFDEGTGKSGGRKDFLGWEHSAERSSMWGKNGTDLFSTKKPRRQQLGELGHVQ